MAQYWEISISAVNLTTAHDLPMNFLVSRKPSTSFRMFVFIYFSFKLSWAFRICTWYSCFRVLVYKFWASLLVSTLQGIRKLIDWKKTYKYWNTLRPQKIEERTTVLNRVCSRTQSGRQQILEHTTTHNRTLNIATRYMYTHLPDLQIRSILKVPFYTIYMLQW